MNHKSKFNLRNHLAVFVMSSVQHVKEINSRKHCCSDPKHSYRTRITTRCFRQLGLFCVIKCNICINTWVNTTQNRLHQELEPSEYSEWETCDWTLKTHQTGAWCVFKAVLSQSHSWWWYFQVQELNSKVHVKCLNM